MLYESTSNRWYKGPCKWNRRNKHKVQENRKQVLCVVSKELKQNGYSIITLKSNKFHYQFKRLLTASSDSSYYGPIKISIYDKYNQFMATWNWVNIDPFTTNNNNNNSNNVTNNSNNNTNNSNNNRNTVSLLDSTDDEDYINDDETSDSEDECDTPQSQNKNKKKSSNNKNKKKSSNNKNENKNKNSNSNSKTHNPHSKQTLYKSRNRYQHLNPPTTVSFYTWDEKKDTVEDVWIPLFKKKQHDQSISKRLQNSITRALQDLSDFKNKFKTIRKDTYHSISELFYRVLNTDDININNNQKVRKYPCKNAKTKINNLNNNSKNKLNNKLNNESNDSNKDNKMFNKGMDSDYCHVCDVFIPEKTKTKQNKHGKDIEIVTQSAHLHWILKTNKEQDKKHIKSQLYQCQFCNDTFANQPNLDSHILYTHTRERRKKTVVDISCGHVHHSVECNEKTCRKPGPNGCICGDNKEICNDQMYASWSTQKRKYLKLCSNSRCKYSLVPQKCENNPKNRSDCVCGDEQLCDWAKINYSVKTDLEINNEYKKKDNVDSDQNMNENDKQETDVDMFDNDDDNNDNDNDIDIDKQEESFDDTQGIDVKEWLIKIDIEGCNLLQYHRHFVQGGFTTIDLIKYINDSNELQQLKINQLAHRLVLMKEIEKLK